MRSLVSQTCKVCQKVFDVDYEKAWARKANNRQTDQTCSSACRDIITYMLDVKDKNRPVLDVKHGTLYGYRRGCRCGSCSEKNKAALRRYREQRLIKIQTGEYTLDCTYICNQCGAEFKRPLSIARGSYKYSKTGKFYCNVRCSSLAREKAKREATR